MNDSLPQLPEHEPHPDLWSRIEHRLDHDDALADNVLNRAVHALPIHEPKADLWSAIEDELKSASGTPTVVRSLWTFIPDRQLWARLAVAAVVVLVGTWLVSQMLSTNTERIEYTVEHSAASVQAKDILADSPMLADKRAEDFIKQQCAEQRLVCQRPEVYELRNQLEELTIEQQRLEHERQVFGDDPTIVRAQVKIENQRVAVTKELITLLRT